MKSVVTGDWHLIEGPLYQYRWDWLGIELPTLLTEVKADRLIILGDLTERTDNHSSILVNRLIDLLLDLPVKQIKILLGNHDYTDPSRPFFAFLNEIKKIDFVYVEEDNLTLGSGITELYIPHWADPNKIKIPAETSRVFLHSDSVGGVYENGYVSTNGIGSWTGKLAEKFDLDFYSGHLHIPQQVHGIIYVGSPYPVKFTSEPVEYGCLVLDDEKKKEKLYGEYDTFFSSRAPRRVTLEINSLEELEKKIKDLSLEEEDHVKIIIKLRPNEFHLFPEIKNDSKDLCGEKGLKLFGISLKKIISRKPERKSGLDKIKKLKTNREIINQYGEKESLGEEVIEEGWRIADEA